MNPMVVRCHPLGSVCNSCEDIECWPQAKRESHVHIIFVMPHHSQECPISGTNGHILVSTHHSKLGHKSYLATCHNAQNKCINSNILNWKWGFRMPSLTLWPSGDDKSTIKHHVPGWLFLGITRKRLTCNPGTGGVAKRPANSTTWDFNQVIISDPRVLKGWKHFGGGRL